jgi:hypothetical protein
MPADATSPAVTPLRARPLTLREQICPPELFTRSQPSWQRWLRRCWARLAPAERGAAPWRPMAGIHAAREAFFLAAADLRGEAADDLRERIDRARSLRELWHLRLDLFNLVSRAHGQAAAEEELQTLNEWFPQRVALKAQSAGWRGLR